MGDTTFEAETVFEPEQCRSVSEAVVKAVADAENVEPIELQPLYDVIDPDALDSLFRPHAARGRITFQYHGYTVEVDGNSTVSLTE